MLIKEVIFSLSADHVCGMALIPPENRFDFSVDLQNRMENAFTVTLLQYYPSHNFS